MVCGGTWPVRSSLVCSLGEYRPADSESQGKKGRDHVIRWSSTSRGPSHPRSLRGLRVSLARAACVNNSGDTILHRVSIRCGLLVRSRVASPSETKPESDQPVKRDIRGRGFASADRNVGTSGEKLGLRRKKEPCSLREALADSGEGRRPGNLISGRGRHAADLGLRMGDHQPSSRTVTGDEVQARPNVSVLKPCVISKCCISGDPLVRWSLWWMNWISQAPSSSWKPIRTA